MKILWAMILISMVVGCGGRSASDTTTLKGTVATGAPLGSGTVTVLDANGQITTTTTNSDGVYSVDISFLTAPLILKFAGYSASGTPLTLYSFIDKKNSNSTNTLNITPMTDAMLALVSGQSGSSFFDAPNFSKINANVIAQSNSILTNRLTSLLAATNTDSSFNFLTSEFSANKSGFDMVLELIQSNTMPSKNSGDPNSIIISGKLASGSIEITPPQGGISTGGNATVYGSIQTNVQMPAGIDFTKIDALISNVNSIVSSNNSVVSRLESLTDNNFRQDGEVKNTIWTNAMSKGLTSLKFSKGSINGCNFGTPFICDVSFLASTSNTAVKPFKFNIPLIYTNGNWFFYGNQNKFNSYIRTTYYNLINFSSTNIQKSPYTAFETFFSTEGAYGALADSAKIYVLSPNGWELIGPAINKNANSFGTPGVDSFVYKEFTLQDSDIDNLYNYSISLGSLQLKMEILDSANNVINTSNFYNVPLPMKQSQLLNMNFLGLSGDGLTSLKEYTGQSSLNMKLDSFGGSFDSISLNKNWSETSNLGISQTSTNLTPFSKSVTVNFSNSISLSPDKYRAFDIFGNDAQGRRLHIKYRGCNAVNCSSN